MSKQTHIKGAIIGFPLGHSRSPTIYTHWIEKYGLTGAYGPRPIAPENLERDVAVMVVEGYTGMNVTMPHKQSIMALCDEVSDEAQRIGAVNTLRIDADKEIYGTNTDAFGFIESIRESAPDFDFTSGPVLVLGAGGAARAVVYGLEKAGVPEIRLTNRTRATAETFDATIYDWNNRESAAKDIALLVNTTQLGMTGQLPLDFDVATLPSSALVCDIVYKPLRTNFLIAAEQRGLVTVGGIGMLLHQARASFHFWTGIMPEIDDELRAKLAETTS